MQTFTSKTPLDRFRNDAFHREAMCEALKDDDARYAPIFDAARASRAAIDAKLADLLRGQDVLRRGRALERARKLRAVAAYDVVRKQLDIAAADVVRVLMPSAPNVIHKSGVKTARAELERAVARLSDASSPESVRTDHLPALQAQVRLLVAADEAEDVSARALAALRAAIILFKADRQSDRVAQLGMLLPVAGKSESDEFFLVARAETGDDEEDVAEPAAPAPAKP